MQRSAQAYCNRQRGKSNPLRKVSSCLNIILKALKILDYKIPRFE
jgi:hypothetical protein